MANVADVRDRGFKITLNDGIERTIRFTLNALAELEEKFGSINAAFDKLEKENSVIALRSILWAGLLSDDPTITELEVGNLIDLQLMQELIDTLGGALQHNLGADLAADLEADSKTVITAKAVDSPNV